MVLLSRRQLLGALSTAAAALAAGTANEAWAKKPPRTRVEWTEVVLPDDDRRAVRTSILKAVLKKESRRVDWGQHAGGELQGVVKVVEFAVSRKEDVMRVTCTAVGKLNKGPAVRTHFSFGGHPHQQEKLEKTMLTLIAQGVITRLSAIARDRAGRPAG
jgi:hypothetical protein